MRLTEASGTSKNAIINNWIIDSVDLGGLADLAEEHGDGTFAFAQKGTTPKSVMERAKELQEFRQWREGRAVAALTRA